MFDFHMHSLVSFDSDDAPELMARAALQQGLKEICFTDHVDDDPKGVDRHRFTIESYNEAYDGLCVPGITIRRGLEFGMLKDNQPLLQEYLSRRHFDFVIGSVHYVDLWDAYYAQYWEGKTQEYAELRYMETTLECVRNHRDFDVLGHLTYISKARSNPTKRLIPYEWYREVYDEILKLLVAKGKGMEINSSGVDRCGDFLPGIAYLKLFKELGGQIVTVGSDAHTTDRVGQYTSDAVAIAGEIFGHVCTFRGRQPLFHKL